jgi:hypothetical protein
MRTASYESVWGLPAGDQDEQLPKKTQKPERIASKMAATKLRMKGGSELRMDAKSWEKSGKFGICADAGDARTEKAPARPTRAVRMNIIRRVMDAT